MELPILPIWLQNKANKARIERLYLDGLFANDGIVKTGDYAVSAQPTPDMTVRVAAGQAWVRGNEITNQGVYSVTNDGIVTVTIPTADSAPRIDLVILRVYDSDVSGSFNEAQIEVVKGFAATSPTPPDLPKNSIPLARISVGAGVGTVTNSNIVDTRVSALFKPEFGGSLWQDSSWIDMTPLAANMSAYGGGYMTPGYRKVGAYKVELRGLIRTGVAISGPSGAADIFQFPTGFIPAKVQLMPCTFDKVRQNSGTTSAHYHTLYWPSAAGRLSVTTTGRMYFQPGGLTDTNQWISLDNNFFILN